jgi:acetoin utilization deacetylase AcuC-like enzyme
VREMHTGIFFCYQQGERLKDFPQALEGILEKDTVFFYDALYPSKPKAFFDLEPISVKTLYSVHAPDMVARVKATGNYEGALYSASGTVAAAHKILSGELTNAFVFTGFGDHHAGSSFFSGGCYLNGAAIAIHELGEKFGAERFSIIDTDAHHGDGTWELFKEDPTLLYLCFCSGQSQESNNKVNIHVPAKISDSDYLAIAQEALRQWVKPFSPEIIFWNWGYDGTVGEYADIGLTPELHLQITREIKKVALEVCDGRVVVVLCGGSRRDYAKLLIPHIIEILADQGV